MKTIVTIALIVEAICVLTAIVMITKELIRRDKEKKIKLKKQKEELLCEYSGLPSVKAYENNIHAKDN
jgi:hypothetical protein